MAPKKAERKANKKKSPKIQYNAYHFRSALAPLIEDIMGLKNLIQERHLRSMKKTPFVTFFQAIHETCTKSNEVVMKILDMYDETRNCFQIGNQFLKFRAKDISVLFGIPLKDEENNKTKKKDVERPGLLFLKRHFPNSNHIKKKDINSAIVKVLPSEVEMDVNDSCILICCLMFCSFFFPYGSGALSKPIMVSLYEEIETANWPERILKELLNSASQYKNMQSALGGCTMALLYWLAEHVSITSMKDGKEEEIPRVVRWDVHQIIEAIRETDFSSIENSKITQNLIVSDLEKNIIGGNFEEGEEESEEEEEESEEEEEKEDKGKRGNADFRKRKKEIEDATLQQNLLIFKGLGAAIQNDIDEMEGSQEEINQLKRTIADLEKENEELKLENNELKSKKAKKPTKEERKKQHQSWKKHHKKKDCRYVLLFK